MKEVTLSTLCCCGDDSFRRVRFRPPRCWQCVQVVGLDTTGGSSDSDGFWKVRNTWGDEWGEGGHIRLQYGSNMCAIACDPMYATITAVN